MSEAHEQNRTAPARGLMAPYRVYRDFLAEGTVGALLDHVLGREAEFAPTRVGQAQDAAINPEVRQSLSVRDLGDFRQVLDAQVRDRAPALMADLRMSPIARSKFELELVAHGDGAFFRRHIDTQVAGERQHIRVLSGVYYFHREPKGFSGGALRLHAIGDDARFIDIEPERNMLLVFPSWAPHEVLPVACPSQRFADARFAINCWIYAKRPQT